MYLIPLNKNCKQTDGAALTDNADINYCLHLYEPHHSVTTVLKSHTTVYKVINADHRTTKLLANALLAKFDQFVYFRKLFCSCS